MPLTFQRLKASTDVLTQPLLNEGVLLDLAGENYFGLNEVALRVWELLQETGDVATIRDRILHEFDVDARRLEDDLNALCAKLVDAGLARVEQK